MTGISRPPRSLQGAGSDEALVRVPGITPRAQSTWDYPQGSRLFAHASDTDDAVTPPTAASDCLGAAYMGLRVLGSPQAGSRACTALV